MVHIFGSNEHRWINAVRWHLCRDGRSTWRVAPINGCFLWVSCKVYMYLCISYMQGVSLYIYIHFRRTDFYIVADPDTPAPMGFPEGVSKKILLQSLDKYTFQNYRDTDHYKNSNDAKMTEKYVSNTGKLVRPISCMLSPSKCDEFVVHQQDGGPGRICHSISIREERAFDHCYTREAISNAAIPYPKCRAKRCCACKADW